MKRGIRLREDNTEYSYILVIISVFMALSAGLFLTNNVLADDDTIVDPVSITVDTSCSISGTGTTHSANLKNGTYSGTEGLGYENGIGKTTMTAFCNDINGFSIYAVGFTGDREGNNTLVGTNTNLTIASGTATSGNTSNWAMKVTKVDNPVSGAEITYHPENMTIANSFNNFHTVPDDYTKVAEYHASSGSSVTDQGTGALGAKLETTYAAFISPDQTADTYIGKVKYVLVHPYDDAAPIILEPPLSTCTTPVPGNITYMQELDNTNTTTIMSNMEKGTQYYLRDRRDGTPYCVAKINGALWMTQNLRITGTISAADSNFTGSDFNVSAYDLKADGASGGACYITNGYNNACSHIPDATDMSTINTDGRNYTTEQIGAWYNFAAASAGTITGDNNETLATEDICPANWHLPSYDTNNSAGSINSLKGNTYSSSFSPVNGGGYIDGSFSGTGYGYWWSSTANTAGRRFYLRCYGTFLDTPNYYRDYGVSIRCVR